MNENRTKFGTPSSPEIMNRYNSNALVCISTSLEIIPNYYFSTVQNNRYSQKVNRGSGHMYRVIPNCWQKKLLTVSKKSELNKFQLQLACRTFTILIFQVIGTIMVLEPGESVSDLSIMPLFLRKNNYTRNVCNLEIFQTPNLGRICWMSQMDSGMMSVGRTTSPLGGVVGKLPHLEIQQIKQPKMHCGDCNSDECQWASINRGVYLCDQCAIIHREMGRHYSQVSSRMVVMRYYIDVQTKKYR